MVTLGVEENKRLLEQKIEETKNLILLQQAEKEKGTGEEDNDVDPFQNNDGTDAAPTDGDKVADGEQENNNNLMSGPDNQEPG